MMDFHQSPLTVDFPFDDFPSFVMEVLNGFDGKIINKMMDVPGDCPASHVG